VHLIPVIRDGYQLVIVNNMHECLIYRDYFGAVNEDEDSSEIAIVPSGKLTLVARLPVPQISVGLIANETLVLGSNIKFGFLQAFDLSTFELTCKSSAMLMEGVTCMCQGENSSTLIVGMKDSKVAAIKAGRAYLEVVASVSLAG